MCEYRYLHAEVLARGQLGAVLAALERLLQGPGEHCSLRVEAELKLGLLPR